MSATKLYVLFKTNNWSEGNRLLGKQKRTKINCHQNFVLLHVTHIILMKLITLKLVRKTMVSRLDSSFPTCSFISEVKDIFRSFFFSLEFFLHKSSCSIFFWQQRTVECVWDFLIIIFLFAIKKFFLCKIKNISILAVVYKTCWAYAPTVFSTIHIWSIPILLTTFKCTFKWQCFLSDWCSLQTLTDSSNTRCMINQSKPKVTRNVTARENKTRAASAAK